MKLTATDITMTYRDGDRFVEVLRRVSLEVEPGTSVAILGQSGVGKSTLLYILGALEQPTSGELVIGDRSITALWRERRQQELSLFRGRHLGFVFQFHYLLPEFDAIENAAMPLLITGKSRDEADSHARKLLDNVGLSHRLNHRPGALSGGEQQRVAVARALATNPAIILADEPTGNLDQRTGEQVTDLLLSVHRESGASLIVVTHSSVVASRMSRVLELTSEGLRDA